LVKQADHYWYSHHVERPLPVLRIEFDDPDRTWFHIAPGTGDILQRTNANQRLYRWLFNALHSFDLRILIANRPAWDVLLWAMSAVGFVMSISGVVIGWRRLRRKAAQSSTQPFNAKDVAGARGDWTSGS
uniref:hypothetical protein n=1 Tax=Ferrovibrio terrae TaxID=2594003 RepID=UPI003137DC71